MIYLRFLKTIMVNVEQAMPLKGLLDSTVMFWLESDSIKALLRLVWSACDKLKLGIINHGSQR